MPSDQSKTTRHAKNYKNVIHTKGEKKQSIKTNSKDFLDITIITQGSYYKYVRRQYRICAQEKSQV